jgi:hypothetical protein
MANSNSDRIKDEVTFFDLDMVKRLPLVVIFFDYSVLNLLILLVIEGWHWGTV